MTHTYRGFSVPDVHENLTKGHDKFFVLDEKFGWLIHGNTEKFVRNQWERYVDSHILEKLIADGKVQWLYENHAGDQFYGCLVCGSVLFDVLAHAQKCGVDSTRSE